MYFQKYGVRKTWLDKCVKGEAAHYPSTSNMVNVPKRC